MCDNRRNDDFNLRRRLTASTRKFLRWSGSSNQASTGFTRGAGIRAQAGGVTSVLSRLARPPCVTSARCSTSSGTD